jgi:acyl-CoA thioester hydrolase
MSVNPGFGGQSFIPHSEAKVRQVRVTLDRAGNQAADIEVDGGIDVHTDQMGVVYYANYFVWFEVGRTDLLRRAGWSYRELEGEGFSLPVVEAHCEYRQPARYDDAVEIRTSGRLLSPVRVRFDYEVVRSDGEAVLASGHTVHASLDTSLRPRRLPDRLLRLLEEGGPPEARPARHEGGA